VTDPEETLPTSMPSTAGSAAGSGSEPRHLAPDDAGERPLIDLSRDPTPGEPDHAAPDDE
jgi:hypothetical protein